MRHSSFSSAAAGVRSHHAAALATANGWTNCYNVLEGFEGDKDANGQRGKPVAGVSPASPDQLRPSPCPPSSHFDKFNQMQDQTAQGAYPRRPGKARQRAVLLCHHYQRADKTSTPI